MEQEQVQLGRLPLGVPWLLQSAAVQGTGGGGAAVVNDMMMRCVTPYWMHYYVGWVYIFDGGKGFVWSCQPSMLLPLAHV